MPKRPSSTGKVVTPKPYWRMVLILLLSAALLSASFLHWQQKPSDAAPLFIGVFAVVFMTLRPDQSGYDRFITILAVSGQILLYGVLAARRRH